MSTNEQNKKQEVVQNGNFKKSETLFSLENRSSNSVKSEFKSGEKRGGEATDVVFNENEETLQSRGKSLESSCNAIDNTKINQTPNQQENQVIIEDSNQSPSEEILKSSGEETTSPEEMSRSSECN